MIAMIQRENKSELGESNSAITCVDLFSGIGGLTHGLIRGGINVVAGIDVDPHCRFPYESNNDSKFIEKDIRHLTGAELAALFDNARFRLLAGCAPCQPFSNYGRSKERRRRKMEWALISDFGRLVREVKPEFITMENVPQLVGHQVFNNFIESLNGYETWWRVVECSQYGVPQTRKRLVLLASRLGPISLVPPTDVGLSAVTVRKAISHLPPLIAGGKDPDDALHSACSLSKLNLRRIRASRPGGTWRDWNKDLLADCHKKVSGETYPSVYGRMEWDAPAPTMTTQCFGYGNGRFGHPEQDRAITLREAAILQTFPKTYCFVPNGEPVRFNILGRLIGNAIPVRIAEVIAQSLLSHLKNLTHLSAGMPHRKRNNQGICRSM
jgi:DNA (cytosine-5)-methyltransferase 1